MEKRSQNGDLIDVVVPTTHCLMEDPVNVIQLPKIIAAPNGDGVELQEIHQEITIVIIVLEE
jgi:hypothetical protein